MAINLSSINSLVGLSYGSFGQGASALRSSASATSRSYGSAATVSLGNSYSAAIKSYGQAITSTNGGVSRVQLAQDGLSKISSNMGRLKELATQASSTTITQADRDKLQVEADKIQKENDSIVSGTKFGSEKLLASKHSNTVQTGVNSWNNTSVSFKDFSKSFTKVDLSTQQGASNALATLDKNISAADKGFDDLGKTRTKLESSLTELNNASSALTQAKASSLNLADQMRMGSFSLGTQGSIDPLRALQLLG
ncbi:MAG: hypothetical protein H7833_05480 [Magnetococcus sp. DMHC-1]